jgi:small subunit ribosomal protein S11e
MTDIQTEKAFQKQDGMFLSSKKLQAKKTSQGVRFYKKVGLGK